ncbi:MAG TPA: hypothetical protein VL475_16035, partial [Planctomycetaceae bacterium]|nr:hypothetical protein [Planctomycetaceae bacterium]
IPGKSTYNVLIVADRLGLPELDALAAPVADWTRDGNDPPWLFTTDQLKTSADAFPIELADIRQSRKTLFGDDLLDGENIQQEHLRLQLERELKGKLLSLRRHYLATRGDNRQIVALMTASLTTFLVLFRGALRLFQPQVPAAKLEALTSLAKHVSFDPQPFRTVHELKTGGKPADHRAAGPLFADYLSAIEKLVDAIDRHIHSRTQ